MRSRFVGLSRQITDDRPSPFTVVVGYFFFYRKEQLVSSLSTYPWSRSVTDNGTSSRNHRDKKVEAKADVEVETGGAGGISIGVLGGCKEEGVYDCSRTISHVSK